jgi:uncharacterized protein (DUF1697 family)
MAVQFTVALLRGINVGGNKIVSMADLRDLCAGLGLADARTLLQSGNLVFRSGGRRGAALEKLLESAAEERLSFRIHFFVRTAEEWKKIIARNPFAEEARRDPGHLLVMCLKAAPKPEAVESLRAAITGREAVRVAGREAYLVYPDGVGRSRLTHALIEKKLGTPGTARNWNTVLKLDGLTSG